MAGATGRAHRKVARAGLLALVAACAVMKEPPGGPPDFDAPVLLEVTPDSGAIADSLRGPIVFQFDEVISEASGGGLDRLFRLSPRPVQLNVGWKRTRIEVRPDEGWRSNRVYQVTLLPGITDLSNNRLQEGRHLVFTTGGPIPPTHIAGEVLDWENGRVGQGAAIEAILLPDSLVYEGRADSAGHYSLEALPVGDYLLIGIIDANNNGRRDRREAFDSSSVRLDSVIERSLWAFVQDTIGPQLQRATAVDSVTVRLQFSQKLAFGDPTDDVVQVWVLPDTLPVPVDAVWDVVVYDSVAAVERAAADSVRAAADSTAADTAVGGVEPSPTPPPPPAAIRAAGSDTTVAQQDTSVAQRLLADRPKLQSEWVVRLRSPLPPGSRYLIQASAPNLNGVVNESRTVLVLAGTPDEQ
ncbi:MAG TPA: Ig-like domain-containing protein [Gemmatimonadales bacterium]